MSFPVSSWPKQPFAEFRGGFIVVQGAIGILWGECAQERRGSGKGPRLFAFGPGWIRDEAGWAASGLARVLGFLTGETERNGGFGHQALDGDGLSALGALLIGALFQSLQREIDFLQQISVILDDLALDGFVADLDGPFLDVAHVPIAAGAGGAAVVFPLGDDAFAFFEQAAVDFGFSGGIHDLID